MSPIEDHPQRYSLANELHARPFPVIDFPSRAAYLAIKPVADAAGRDRDADHAHLISLLDRYGVAHPQPGATHYTGQLGRHLLKWESHTEFVTYTLIAPGVAERPFDGETFSMFPETWLAEAPGARITSALIRIETMPDDDAEIAEKLGDWMVPESLAVSRILDNTAVMAGDFRIDAAGHMRFALFAAPDLGKRRLGRIVSRLTEIETYKTVSMLGLPRARALSQRMGELDHDLTTLVGEMTGSLRRPEESLERLLSVAAELEKLLAESTFRFGATAAYEAIVLQRIAVLREERFGGRQTFQEFMTRRFDPAMRTVKSTEARLHAMAERATRAGDLLRTRVDVERQAQNQKVLESMDQRADLQLRLQKTVEGLSVVAISYYALNLLIYLLQPVGEAVGIGKLWLSAGLAPLVVIGVWLIVRQIRKSME